MEFTRINEREHVRHIGRRAPWTAETGVSPERVRAGVARGRELHAQAVRRAFGAVARGLLRLIRRRLPRVPAGAHGLDAIDFDCAHGRPC